MDGGYGGKNCGGWAVGRVGEQPAHVHCLMSVVDVKRGMRTMVEQMTDMRFYVLDASFAVVARGTTFQHVAVKSEEKPRKPRLSAATSGSRDFHDSTQHRYIGNDSGHVARTTRPA